jgi:hypothetical protein
VETTKGRNNAPFELLPSGSKQGLKGSVILKKRILIGRSQTCDLVINHPDVTAIHAILEVDENGAKIFDMKSTNGTYVDGKKVLSTEIKPGTTIKFGSQEFIFKEFNKAEIAEAPLDLLNDSLPPIIESEKSLPKSGPGTDAEKELLVPQVIYPLTKDPKAEFSEYIFEDADVLFPIFKYRVDSNSVEIIVLYKDTIYSVDYLPLKNGIYKLVGINPGSKDIEYAYLGKDERVPFVEIKNKKVKVHPLNGYDLLSLSKHEVSDTSSGSLDLGNEDVLRFGMQDIQIFVRQTESPPKVDSAPILRRDREFWKYIIVMLILATSFLLAVHFTEVDEEIEKEKVPERIASILYKIRPVPKPVVKKKPTTPKKYAKIKKDLVTSNNITKVSTKSRSVSPKDIKKKNSTPKEGDRKARKMGKVKVTKANKGPNDRRTNIVRAKSRKKAAGKRYSQRTVRKRAVRNNKNKGRVQAFKSFDFKQTLSSLLTRGGKTKKLKAADVDSSDLGTKSMDSGTRGATLKRSNVKDNVGNLFGDSNGVLDSSKGIPGVSGKKSIYTAGLPWKTLIIGGMDPNTIRKILIDHIPQFHSCYQKELEADRSKAVSGIVRLNFLIGASGHVTKAGIDSRSDIPAEVKSCVINVLKGIPFPAPLAGGVVEVNQPMNFYPRRK